MTYYWIIKREDGDAYHWHKCHVNHYPDAGWTKGDKIPANREQCNHCKAIDDEE